LYHNNAAKISTTATGIDVQGQVIATKGSTGTLATFTDGVATNFTLKTDGSSVGTFGTEAGSTQLAFMVANTEAARFDGSRNLLIGKTALGTANDGLQVKPTGELVVTRDGNHSLILNRKSSDGNIALFQKDGTTFCSIGVMNTNNPYIANDADNSGLQFGSGSITPAYDGAGQNNSVDLGSSSTRFKIGYFNDSLRTRYFVGIDDSNTYIEMGGSDVMKFVAGGAERGRFQSSNGVFQVGKTDASLSTSGSYHQGDGFIGATRSDNPPLGLNRLDGDGDIAIFQRAGNTVGSIGITSSGVTYNTTSDIRLKQDIEPLAATDKLMAMNPVSYNWKADPDGPRSMGFIAQEMQEVMPEAVSTGDDDMMQMDYGRITPILVSALQDAHKKIEQLEQRIADMEAN